jgi:hypothetical protein
MRAPTMSLGVSNPLLELTFTIIIPRLDEFFPQQPGSGIFKLVLQW